MNSHWYEAKANALIMLTNLKNLEEEDCRQTSIVNWLQILGKGDKDGLPTVPISHLE